MKTTVLALVADLSLGQADQTRAGEYYDNIITELGREEWFTQKTLIDSTPEVATYELPANALKLLYTFYDDRVLHPIKPWELDWFSPNWRDRRGKPVSAVTMFEQDKQFRLYPVPVDPQDENFAFLLGDPFGNPGRTNSIAVLHTEIRTDVQEWLDLPLALLVLEREYQRESRHKDAVLAQSFGDLGRLFLEVLR